MPTAAAGTLDAGDEVVTLSLDGAEPIVSANIHLVSTSATTPVVKVRARPRGQSAFVNVAWLNLANMSLISGGNQTLTDSTDYIMKVPDLAWADQVQIYLVSIASGSFAASVYGLSAKETSNETYSFPVLSSSVAQTITSTSATALTVGANGATNPVFSVNANTASVATGLTIIGAAAASGVAMTVISSGTNENLAINAKGSGTISLNATATGTVTIGSSLTFADAKNVIFNATTGTKIGTATTQKLAFYNSTPIVQPAASTDTTTGAAGGTTTVFLNTTYTGGVGSSAYTVGGILASLKNLGLLAA